MRFPRTPQPELQNTRILHIVGWIIRIPFALARAGCAAIFKRCRSPEQLHEAAQLRQSRVRRELRGLPPDHVAPAGKS